MQCNISINEQEAQWQCTYAKDAFEQSLCYKLQNALHILFPSLNNTPLTETALIFASRLVICLKYCSGAMA